MNQGEHRGESLKGVALAVLILVTLFAGLGSYDLSAPDEPRFALVAREMMRDGQWLMPHRNERPYPDKPPLFFWSIAGLAYLNGGEINAWTARLPVALSALGVLFLIFQWVGLDKNKNDVGWKTVFILLTTFRFVLNARTAQIDMLLCLCITAASVYGYRALTGAGSRSWLIGLFLGLGILAKGPVGYLVPVGIWCVFCWFRKSWKNFPLKSLLWGLLPPLIWIGLLGIEVAAQGEWDYFHNLLFKQTVTRAFNPWHHHRAWYYFAMTVLHDGLPWTPMLLAALPLRARSRAGLSDHGRFAWAAVLFTLVFFSLSSGKRSVYILPLYPFLAYLVANWLYERFQTRDFGLSTRIPMVISGAVLILLGGILLVVAQSPDSFSLPESLTKTLPVISLTLMGVLIVFWAGLGIYGVARAKGQLAFQCFVLSMAMVLGTMFLIVMPFVSPYRSARQFTEQATQIIAEQDSDPVVGMVLYRSAYRFYGRYPLVELRNQEGEPDTSLPDIPTYFQTHPKGWLIVRSYDWKPYEEQRKTWLSMEVGRGDTFLLLGPRSQETRGEQ